MLYCLYIQIHIKNLYCIICIYICISCLYLFRLLLYNVNCVLTFSYNIGNTCEHYGILYIYIFSLCLLEYI